MPTDHVVSLIDQKLHSFTKRGLLSLASEALRTRPPNALPAEGIDQQDEGNERTGQADDESRSQSALGGTEAGGKPRHP